MKWSPKEELGHLLDSAANNHQRIVRALLEDQPAMPGYEQHQRIAPQIQTAVTSGALAITLSASRSHCTAAPAMKIAPSSA